MTKNRDDDFSLLTGDAERGTSTVIKKKSMLR